MALLQERLNGWTKKGEGITSYLVEVKFEDLEKAEERDHLALLPTRLQLETAEVDNLKDAARRLLRKSEDFQRLLRDLRGVISTH